MADGGVQITGLRELVRDLESVGVEISDLKDAFGSIAQRAATLASAFAPRRSGALAASIRGNRAKNYATVKAGSTRVPYAGPINYGWPRRHIEPARFMQRADEAIRPTVLSDLESSISQLIARKGLA